RLPDARQTPRADRDTAPPAYRARPVQPPRPLPSARVLPPRLNTIHTACAGRLPHRTWPRGRWRAIVPPVSARHAGEDHTSRCGPASHIPARSHSIPGSDRPTPVSAAPRLPPTAPIHLRSAFHSTAPHTLLAESQHTSSLG